MLKHVELDRTLKLEQQFADTSIQPTILVNVFDVDPKDRAAFKLAWAEDAAFFKRQPGYISAQLHQGIQGSSMFLNYAVFEGTKSFAGTTHQPSFEPLRRIYPDGSTAHPHLFRRLAVPGICTGDEEWSPNGQNPSTSTHGLTMADLDPSTPITAQLPDSTHKKPTIQITVYDVDPSDRDAFVTSWQKQAAGLMNRPGCLSQQLHTGLLGSRLFMSYTIWEQTSALADALAAIDTAAVNAHYPDSVTARSHLFRRLHIPGICVGEADGREKLAVSSRMMPAG
ncbi:MAG: antibiotic biosynthesis monooxygenase [Actinobacteria bacterium]|nr:antibiotic biosynthesis monooxygenase [Actinomycetota bacterium]